MFRPELEVSNARKDDGAIIKGAGREAPSEDRGVDQCDMSAQSRRFKKKGRGRTGHDLGRKEEETVGSAANGVLP